MLSAPPLRLQLECASGRGSSSTPSLYANRCAHLHMHACFPSLLPLELVSPCPQTPSLSPTHLWPHTRTMAHTPTAPQTDILGGPTPCVHVCTLRCTCSHGHPVISSYDCADGFLTGSVAPELQKLLRPNRWKGLQVSSLRAFRGSQLLLGLVRGSEALASSTAFCKDLTFSLNSFIWPTFIVPHHVSVTVLGT